MKRVIKNVIETGNKGLKLTPQMKENTMNIVAYTDSDFTGNKRSRISLSGFILLFTDATIIWSSKAQHSVALISSKSEYIELSKADKEVKSMLMLLKIMILEVRLSITVRLDDIGELFMSENITTSNRTNNVDTRYRFVNEFVDDGFIENIFVKTK